MSSWFALGGLAAGQLDDYFLHHFGGHAARLVMLLRYAGLRFLPILLFLWVGFVATDAYRCALKKESPMNLKVWIMLLGGLFCAGAALSYAGKIADLEFARSMEGH